MVLSDLFTDKVLKRFTDQEKDHLNSLLAQETPNLSADINFSMTALSYSIGMNMLNTEVTYRRSRVSAGEINEGD